MDYGITIRVAMPFAEAVPQVRDALGAQGFGVLTEIDVQATLRDKLGEDMEPYLILGACNPPHPCYGVCPQTRAQAAHRLPVLPPGRQHGEAVIISRSRAWSAARMRDYWHGYHGTNDSRSGDTPLGIFGLLGKSAWRT